MVRWFREVCGLRRCLTLLMVAIVGLWCAGQDEFEWGHADEWEGRGPRASRRYAGSGDSQAEGVQESRAGNGWRTPIVIGPSRPDRLERLAVDELVRYLQVAGARVMQETGSTPSVPRGRVLVLGRPESNPLLQRLLKATGTEPPRQPQAFRIRAVRNPADAAGEIVLLCGADPLGVLYAVRDFAHYMLYRSDHGIEVKKADIRVNPPLKVRMLSESGCNLFSADNDHEGFMRYPRLNRFSRNVVFDKEYFVEWLSEWKVTHVNLVWCNYPAYQKAVQAFLRAAHAKGIKVFFHFVPYRPAHEAPPRSVSTAENVDADREADCPRDPRVRRWYMDRLAQLCAPERGFDGVVLESPYHDGVYCHCRVCQGQRNPYPEAQMLAEMVQVVRAVRPELPVVQVVKQPVPNKQAAEELARRIRRIPIRRGWYVNTYRDRAHRRHWFALGPEFATYLRLYRSALRGKDPAREINFLFRDFQLPARHGVFAQGFCYRFYAGRYGSFPVEQDREMMTRYPDRKGPFSLALVAEAMFDPFVAGRERAEKVRRIYELTIPDYPRSRPLNESDFQAIAHRDTERQQPGQEEQPAAGRRRSERGLFKRQWSIPEPSFSLAQICADVDGDGRREIFFAERRTRRVRLLDAASGRPKWTVRLQGDHQSACAYDLNRDGLYEIIYTTSSPGRLYVLDPRTGKVLGRWDAPDWKLGNSPVIIDVDQDGRLDGLLGSRTRFLFRIDMHSLRPIAIREGWSQCGCHTSALDVDGDGQWDLFAGSGDDHVAKGTLHRFDPLTLRTVWSFATNDNASSADPVLADIDGDGAVEIVKSVDNYAGDDAHDAIYAFETDGRLLWRVTGFAQEDSPNVADLDGDGDVEIVGMTFGGVVYCLDGQGRVLWKRDLRPELDDAAHAYMTPVLCDVDGDPELEIVAVTNGPYFDTERSARGKPHGVIFALDARGNVLDRFDVGGPRFWGTAFACNVDDDPYLELVLSGSGGADVIETRGLGPNTEHFQRRRTYQRLNVLPWAYEDTYFIYRGRRENVVNQTDNIVLARRGDAYCPAGSFVTELLQLPPGTEFHTLEYRVRTPAGTRVDVDILDARGRPLLEAVRSGTTFSLRESVRLRFRLSTSDPNRTPILDSYRLRFRSED